MATQGLSSGTVLRIVNTYIGVSGGYLNGFSYRILEEFYPSYCDLEINPWDYGDGTTRARFTAVLEKSPPDVQAKILRGIIEMIPEPSADVPRKMTKDEMLGLIHQLEGLGVPTPKLGNTRQVVERALGDAETLLHSRDATSAVDRLHTALHGHLKALCDSAGIAYESDASAARLLKVLRDGHPALQSLTPQARNALKILMAMGTAVDSVGTIRNNESVAHANESLAEAPEAMLAINATRTILAYLDARLGSEHVTLVKSSA